MNNIFKVTHKLGQEERLEWAGVKAGKKNLPFVSAMPKLPADREAKLCRKKEACPEKC